MDYVFSLAYWYVVFLLLAMVCRHMTLKAKVSIAFLQIEVSHDMMQLQSVFSISLLFPIMQKQWDTSFSQKFLVLSSDFFNLCFLSVKARGTK